MVETSKRNDGDERGRREREGKNQERVDDESQRTSFWF